MSTQKSFIAASGILPKQRMPLAFAPGAASGVFARQPAPAASGRDHTIATMAGDLLPLCDFAGLLLAGYFSLFSYAIGIDAALTTPHAWNDLVRLVWVSAALAPFLLYEQRFAGFAEAGDNAALVRLFAGRFLIFLAVIAVIAFAGRWLDDAPHGWRALWLSSVVLLCVTTRVLLARYLRHRSQRQAPPPAVDAAVAAPATGYVGDGLPVTLLADRPIKRWNAVFKSAKDRVLSFIIMVLLLPVLACIALAIKLDSPGPILFKQRRHGYNNGEFDIYKFRTMHCTPAASSDALIQTVRGDPRVTRVGRFLRKWSLDELPQVFNVLEGTMSLVGPRPHAVNMRTEARLGQEIVEVYPHRHRVKPGITGWSQINGARGATDTVEQLRRRVELDLYYVEHQSPLLDLKILTLTFREVLRATNAF